MRNTNAILSKKLLDFYDYNKLRDLVVEIFDLFDYLKTTDDKIVFPRITSDYKVKYEQSVQTQSSQVEYCSLKNLMLEGRNEEMRKELFSKIETALKQLNEVEKQTFYFVFYENKNEYEISRLIHHGHKKVRDIRKSACVKFLLVLALDDKCFKNEDM